MPKSVNQKYMEVTENILNDVRFEPVAFAVNMSRQPLYTQKRFMNIIHAVIDAMASYVDNGFVPMGSKEIAHACYDMREILDKHFPTDSPPQFKYDGTEWEQI